MDRTGLFRRTRRGWAGRRSDRTGGLGQETDGQAAPGGAGRGRIGTADKEWNAESWKLR